MPLELPEPVLTVFWWLVRTNDEKCQDFVRYSAIVLKDASRMYLDTKPNKTGHFVKKKSR